MSKRATPSVNSHRQSMNTTNEQHSHNTTDNSNSTDDAATRSSRRRAKYDCVLSGRYRLQRTLGVGNFAKVKLAIHVPTGKEVAIKIIDKNELTASGRRKVGCTCLTLLFIPVFWKLTREVQLMKELSHPNIVKLLEIIETERFTYLVLEYLKGGEVYDYLVKYGKMTEKMAREKFRQILSAVEYCHQKGIIHRDLKTENLLFDEHMNVKLVDFGFANKFNHGSKLNTFCGSAPYAAPELFRGKEYNGPEVDIWSLGVILYKLVSGSLPFDGQSLSELRHQVVKGYYRVPFYMTTACENLLKKMIRVEPRKRNSIMMIMNDRWINTGYENDLLEPYVEPKKNLTDPKRFNALIQMDYSVEAIVKSLKEKRFDEIHAAYMLADSNPVLHPAETVNGRPPSPAESKRNSVDFKQPRVNFQEVNARRVNGDTGKATREPLVNGTATGPDHTEQVNGVSNKPRVILITSPNKNGDLDDSRPANSYEPKLSNLDEKPDTTAYLPEPLPNSDNSHDFRTAYGPYRGEPELEKQPVRNNIPVRSKTFNNKKFDDAKANYSGGHVITIDTAQNSTGPDDDNWQDPAADGSTFSRYKPIRRTVHVTRCDDRAKRNSAERRTPDKLSVVGKARINLFEVDENEPLTVGAGEDKDGVNRSRTFLRTLTSKITRNKPLDDRPRTVTQTYQPDKHLQPQVAHDYAYMPRTDAQPVVTANPWQNTFTVEAEGNKDMFSANEQDSSVNNEPVASGSSKHADNTGSPRGLAFLRTWTARIKKRSGSKSSEGSNPTVAPTSARSSNYTDDRERAIYVDPIHITDSEKKTSSRPLEEKSADSGSWTTAKGPFQSKLTRAATTVQAGSREKMSNRSSKFYDEPGYENNLDASQHQTKPRTLKFSMFVKNTSRMPLDQIQPEVKRTLAATGCVFEHSTQFRFICEHGSHDQKDFVQFELEICTLSLKNCFAIHYKKISGEYLHYRNLISRIAKEMNI